MITYNDLKKGDVLARNDMPYPHGALQITEHDGKLAAYPLGGGFHIRLVELLEKRGAEFHIATPEEAIPKYKMGLYYIDDPDSTKYVGFDCGLRWNGWAMPEFAKTIAVKVCESAGFDWWYYHEADDGFYTYHHQWNDGSIDDVEFWGGRDITLEDGTIVHVYDVGAGCWIWDKFEWTEEESISCDKCGEPIESKDIWDWEDQKVCEGCYLVLKHGGENLDNLRGNGPHQAKFNRKDFD